MKGPSNRSVLLLAVPTAVTHLLTEEPIDDAVDVLAEIRSQCDDFAVDARLDLAGKEGLAIVLPRNVLADPADGLPRFQSFGIESESPQQHQAPRRGGPFRKERALPLGWQGFPPLDRLSRGQSRGRALVPLAVMPLERQQTCAPALARDSGTLGRDVLLGRVGEVAHDLPADRRIRVQQPIQ